MSQPQAFYYPPTAPPAAAEPAAAPTPVPAAEADSVIDPKVAAELEELRAYKRAREASKVEAELESLRQFRAREEARKAAVAAGPPAPLPQPLGGGFGNPPGSNGGPIGGKRVVVLNLPWQTTWQALKEFFAGVGAITRAEIASDEDGRSRGYGTVRFSSEEEAARAIATLNGAEFEGRIITVRMDKYQQ